MKIEKISGPLIIGSQMKGTKMHDLVRIGKKSIIGEIIQLNKDKASIQVYEDTFGLKPGEEIISTDAPLSIELGPGLLGSILDGIGRPLPKLWNSSGDFIARGIDVPTLSREVEWEFTPTLESGCDVKYGEILGHVQETSLIQHRLLSPAKGKLLELRAGKVNVEEIIGKIETSKGEEIIKLSSSWPVRESRPVKNKLEPDKPLISGQRVFDTLFPLMKGGTAAIPGPFGAGKTVSQHQLAKWVDADIVVYIGCGERGNEMTEVLDEFPNLTDPKTGKTLMERTILIANTSNMPVAARESSIYTGITIAEYYRDMGYDVALMADSTSRWAEALREISSRLEEMPGEEGYPAYLSSRLSAFYERSGKVVTLNNMETSLSVIGAVSPPGGDFSEPVTQNTLRITKVFWALDAMLAYRRHFPAINWLTSYSLYANKLTEFYKGVGKDYPALRDKIVEILQKENELIEIVQLVGPDALPEEDKLTMDVAKKIREDFLQQHAYHDVDSFCDINKQYQMLKVLVKYNEFMNKKIDRGAKFNEVIVTEINDKIGRMKYQKDYNEFISKILDELNSK